MTVKRYVRCLGFQCSNNIPETVPSGTCDRCITQENAELALIEPVNWHEAPRDDFYLIIEAGYHCAHTDAEVRQMLADKGIEQPSDESLACIRGSYADFEAACFEGKSEGRDSELDSALFCAEQMALDIQAAEQVFETFQVIRGKPFEEAVAVTHLDASFIGTGERTAFHSEPVKIKIAHNAKDPLTGCDHKGQLTYHDHVFDRCKSCGCLVDAIPF